MRNLILLFLFATSLWACNQDSKGKSTETATDPPAQETPAQAGTLLPGIPLEILQNLWENCDMIDYVFYKLPISMSLDNKPSIQNALSHVAKQPAPVLPQCKSMGRIFYQIEGENVLMAEMYFSQGCNYLVFLKEEKPAYANFMTPHAIEYLNDVFTQAGITPEQLK